MGDIGCGREEIAKALDNLIHKSMTGAKAKTANESVRLLTAEFAIWQGSLEIQKPDGSLPMKGYVIQVMKKVDHKWMIREAHPKLFPPQKQ